jgi:hypothetical protein
MAFAEPRRRNSAEAQNINSPREGLKAPEVDIMAVNAATRRDKRNIILLAILLYDMINDGYFRGGDVWKNGRR